MEEAMASGSDPTFIYAEMLMPSLRIIGEEWETGTRSIGEEHRASEVASRLIGRMSPRFARRGPSRGTIVLGMVPGELHCFAAAVLSDFLRIAGFEPINLGANTPSDSFVEVARRADRLQAVMVGATNSRSDEAVRGVVQALKRSELTIPILVGGRAIVGDEHALHLGADGWSGSDAEEAVARVDSLISSMKHPVAPRRTRTKAELRRS